MKRYVIFLAVALFAATGAAQNRTSYNLTESGMTPPVFLADETYAQGNQVKSLNDFLNKTINYPQESVKCCLQGTEVVEFIVNCSGEPTAFKVLNSICPEIDQEVIRTLKLTAGKWIPGTLNGSPVAMKQEIAVVFQLCSSDDFINKAKKYARKGNHLLFAQNKPKKAIKYYNYALTFMPFEENLLAARSLCLYRLGDLTGAATDWERIQVLTLRNSDDNPGELAKIYSDRSTKEP